MNSAKGITLNNIDKGLRNACNKIKEEFEEHLLAINENTAEIQQGFECVSELDSKINKLNERIDSIQLMLAKLVKNSKIILSRVEQKIFLVLYLYGGKDYLSYADIARRIEENEMTVREHISLIIGKGVGIAEKKVEETVFFKLDSSFRERQTRERLIDIDATVSNELLNQRLINY